MDNKKIVTVDEWRDEMSKRLPSISKMDPRVKMNLGDLEVILEFDNQAALDLLDDTKFNLIADPLTPDTLKDPKLLGHIIHRGVQKHQPNLTLKDVNAKLSIRQFTYYHFTLSSALSGFFPDMGDIEIEKKKETEDTVDFS